MHTCRYMHGHTYTHALPTQSSLGCNWECIVGHAEKTHGQSEFGYSSVLLVEITVFSGLLERLSERELVLI